jgi:hypothetical protein
LKEEISEQIPAIIEQESNEMRSKTGCPSRNQDNNGGGKWHDQTLLNSLKAWAKSYMSEKMQWSVQARAMPFDSAIAKRSTCPEGSSRSPTHSRKIDSKSKSPSTEREYRLLAVLISESATKMNLTFIYFEKDAIL